MHTYVTFRHQNNITNQNTRIPQKKKKKDRHRIFCLPNITKATITQKYKFFDIKTHTKKKNKILRKN